MAFIRNLGLCFLFQLSIWKDILVLGSITTAQSHLVVSGNDMSSATESSAFAHLNGQRYPPVACILNVERYPVAPAPLELEQVHVYVRHGERTPVGIRLASAPANVPQHWDMCRTARRFSSAFSDLLGPNTHSNSLAPLYFPRKIVERPNGKAVEGECLLGELTDLGKQSTYHYGANLRRLYVDRLGFLPDTLHDHSSVYFRTTNMPRTTESLQEIIRGLYPTEKCHPSAIPTIRVRNGKDENLIGNTYSCKRLEVLQHGFAKAAADAFNPTLEHLDAKLSKYINGNPIRIDGRPRASGILDTVRSATAHGIKVPPEFEDRTITDPIETAVVSEWFAGYKTEEVRRLGMGRLLDDMVRKMQHKLAPSRAGHEDGSQAKVLVHSTHDTAIAALCQTFDVYDQRWPDFTASITFELFKAKPAPTSAQGLHLLKASDEHYVRMRYQNKDMHLPVCAEEGKHLAGRPEFCTLKAFTERVKQLTPKDFDAECDIGSAR